MDSDHQVGIFKLLDKDSNFKGKIFKKEASNHYWLLDKIANKEPLQFSAAYDSVDVPCPRGDVDYLHTDIELHNAVITKHGGRCGDSCAA